MIGTIFIILVFIILLTACGWLLYLLNKKNQENKKLSQLLKEYEETKEKLSKFEEMKNEFVSIITHELSTPVARALGYLSLIYEDKENLTPQMEEYIERATQAIKKLSALVSALLRASRITFESKENVFNIANLINEVLKEYEEEAHRKNLTLVFDPGSHLPLPFVKGSPSSIKELLGILLDNAIKFTEKGYVRVSVLVEKDYLYVNVEDTGCGISEKDLPHIFEKFYQADTSYTRKYGGVGLGLYLAQKIIEINKGRIWVKSKEGVGTIVTFALPIAKNI